MNPVRSPVGIDPIPDLVCVAVERGERVVVLSDLRLGIVATDVSTASAIDAAQLLNDWAGPGVVVLAGNTFDLFAAPHDPALVLDAHRQFTNALSAFSNDGERQLVVLPGHRDAALGWFQPAQVILQERVGAILALAVDLDIETGEGPRKVRVEPGHRFDPFYTADPRDQSDTPLGYHLTTEVAPALEGSPRWMAGINQVDDPADVPMFVASRVAYRRVARHLGWLVVPFIAVVALRLALLGANLIHMRGVAAGIDNWWARVAALSTTILVDAGLVIGALALVGRRALESMTELGSGLGTGARNDAARRAAVELLPEGLTGLVTGHTRQPELSELGSTFYANAGSGAVVVRSCPARLGMPPVFTRSCLQ